jgi:hypothetical protein
LRPLKKYFKALYFEDSVGQEKYFAMECKEDLNEASELLMSCSYSIQNTPWFEGRTFKNCNLDKNEAKHVQWIDIVETINHTFNF